jgi:hypothetical protein
MRLAGSTSFSLEILHFCSKQNEREDRREHNQAQMSKPSKNYIYMTKEDVDKPIYRVMPAVRFLQILHDGQLTLLKPKKWDDPFENMLLSARVTLADTSSGDMRNIRESVYGLCWTKLCESDAMWRIYSPYKDGVRLKSTPRKLLGSLQSVIGKFATISCFIGSVQYHDDQPALIKALTDLQLFTPDGVVT